ncbi:MAG: DnaJ domain-containing protein [Bacteroidetes bacterium]|nr:DnaJ domain-containing protein [Bacteroidota bacterium]
MTSSQAYAILGIPTNADLEKIRKAYRQKAKESHPDVNKSPNAQELFIEINEAYEFLVKTKTGKIYSDKSQKFYSPEKNKKRRPREWTEAEKKKARERALQYSQISYEDTLETFIYNRGVFKITELFPKTVWTLCIGFALFIILGVPAIGFSSGDEGSAIGMSLVILFMTSPFLISVARALRD